MRESSIVQKAIEEIYNEEDSIEEIYQSQLKE